MSRAGLAASFLQADQRFAMHMLRRYSCPGVPRPRRWPSFSTKHWNGSGAPVSPRRARPPSGADHKTGFVPCLSRAIPANHEHFSLRSFRPRIWDIAVCEPRIRTAGPSLRKAAVDAGRTELGPWLISMEAGFKTGRGQCHREAWSVSGPRQDGPGRSMAAAADAKIAAIHAIIHPAIGGSLQRNSMTKIPPLPWVR